MRSSVENNRWVRRWRYMMAPTSRRGIWKLKDGGYFVRVRVTDPRTGRRVQCARALRGLTVTIWDAIRVRDQLRHEGSAQLKTRFDPHDKAPFGGDERQYLTTRALTTRADMNLHTGRHRRTRPASRGMWSRLARDKGRPTRRVALAGALSSRDSIRPRVASGSLGGALS
jgi:hypothetical protein